MGALCRAGIIPAGPFRRARRFAARRSPRRPFAAPAVRRGAVCRRGWRRTTWGRVRAQPPKESPSEQRHGGTAETRAAGRAKAKTDGKGTNGRATAAAKATRAVEATPAVTATPAVKATPKVRPTSGGIKLATVRGFDKEFAGEPRNRLALNAVTAGKMQVVARNREAVVRAAQRSFSHSSRRRDH